jgi:hypothetical protein
MPVLGSLIKQGLKLSTRVRLGADSPIHEQRRELRKLLRKAQDTAFGRHFGFEECLEARNFVRAFQERVPFFNYNTLFEQWWHRCLEEEEDICWPGHVKYFALSSGTSESASKHIPVTRDMVRALRKASIRQMVTLSKYDLPASFFTKGILWLGGSTDLKKYGGYFEGDVSGISARRVPIWFQRYYKPGRKISREKDWTIKLDDITEQAPQWDIGIITGIPSWVQLLLEKIIERYKLKTIHDLWPNLRVYAHGGVSFEPYRTSFEKFFATPVHFIEMYPASEGFIAFQAEPGVRKMKLITSNGIFYEFVPFDDTNFDESGELRPAAKACLVNEVEEGKDYAILLSTCAGAWRYLLGDVVRFVSRRDAEIVITGRTKHFLSLVGEHLSVDNMNQAIRDVSLALGTEIPEYTVAGIPYDGSFAHQWYVGTHGAVDRERIRQLLDERLKALNDDYAVERIAALREVKVDVVPVQVFYDFLRFKGRLGGQNKFPRVMKSAQHAEWQAYLKSADGAAH